MNCESLIQPRASKATTCSQGKHMQPRQPHAAKATTLQLSEKEHRLVTGTPFDDLHALLQKLDIQKAKLEEL